MSSSFSVEKVKLVAQFHTTIAAVVAIVTHSTGMQKEKTDVLFDKSLTKLILFSFFLSFVLFSGTIITE
jgi:hypothetical protein